MFTNKIFVVLKIHIFILVVVYFGARETLNHLICYMTF